VVTVYKTAAVLGVELLMPAGISTADVEQYSTAGTAAYTAFTTSFCDSVLAALGTGDSGMACTVDAVLCDCSYPTCTRASCPTTSRQLLLRMSKSRRQLQVSNLQRTLKVSVDYTLSSEQEDAVTQVVEGQDTASEKNAFVGSF
jgi:hypothetical protein